MMNSMDAAVDIQGLRVRRGKNEVLHSIDVHVPRGSLVGLLGPSGSGKTTLMRAIVGVQREVAGRVTVLGSPAGEASLRRRVGYMTQEVSLYDDLTVRQNVAYFSSILGSDRAEVDRVIEATDLTPQANQLVATLSGGERSRASLAGALLGSPELLVLDEPTVGLDPVLRVELWTIFRRLAEQGATLLVSSHVMDEATRCDRLLLMRDGDILADDTLDGLREKTGAADAEGAFLALIKSHPKHAAATAEEAS
ncbi:MAG TPA: ABC transporter ATP-binding protein [Homoserinimonas sp.]|nr:ABC transporter ATP-binding protein [Homoserinimonas sp.]